MAKRLSFSEHHEWLRITRCNIVAREGTNKDTHRVLELVLPLQKFLLGGFCCLQGALGEAIIDAFELLLQLELLVLVVGHVFLVGMEDFTLLRLVVLAEKVKSIVGNACKRSE